MANPQTGFHWVLFLVLLPMPFILEAQKVSIESEIILPEEVSESSGIIFLNDKIITHNDSGGRAILYEVDPDTGALIRELVVNHASNVDWEDICFDQQYLYIGDFGNNNGDRTDLRIYRISLQDYFQSSNDSVSADTIRFAYEDQTSFDVDPLTNFDAEAIISFEDNLYVFTKNRGDLHSNIYSIPKEPGSYQVQRVGRINTEGFVTGAVHNTSSQEIMLTGHTLTEPFLLRLSQFSGRDFAGGEQKRLTFQIPGSFQVEAIEAINHTDYYLTSEANALGEAKLLRVNTDFLVGVDNFHSSEIQIYPNPVSKTLKIKLEPNPEPLFIELTDLNGKRIYKSATFENNNRIIEIDLSEVSEGNYLVSLTTPSWQVAKKLILTNTGH